MTATADARCRVRMRLNFQKLAAPVSRSPRNSPRNSPRKQSPARKSVSPHRVLPAQDCSFSEAGDKEKQLLVKVLQPPKWRALCSEKQLPDSQDIREDVYEELYQNAWQDNWRKRKTSCELLSTFQNLKTINIDKIQIKNKFMRK